MTFCGYSLSQLSERPAALAVFLRCSWAVRLVASGTNAKCRPYLSNVRFQG
jgi:hypothetical protein